MSAIITINNADFSANKVYKIDKAQIDLGPVVDNSFWKKDGTTVSFDGFQRTEKMEIPAGYNYLSAYCSCYIKNSDSTGSPFAAVIFFDENDNVLSFLQKPAVILEAANVSTYGTDVYAINRGYGGISVPAGATKFALSWFCGGVNTASSMLSAKDMGMDRNIVQFSFLKK